jgi:putative intracellular protease/amidase
VSAGVNAGSPLEGCCRPPHDGVQLRVSYPELVVQPDAEAAGATWVQDAPVVVDGNLVTSPHPRHSAAFSAAIAEVLRGK